MVQFQKEKVYIIYNSYKPLDFKIKGLNYVSKICNDYELISNINSILEEYDLDIDTLENSEEHSYYKLEFEDKKMVSGLTFQTYDEVKDFIKESGNQGKYKITKYEFDDPFLGVIENNFIFDENNEIISVKYENRKMGFPIDCNLLHGLIVETPSIYEKNGMKIVEIYDPDFTTKNKLYLLSNDQDKFNAARLADILLAEKDSKEFFGGKFTGPIAEDLIVNKDNEFERKYKCIYEFMNMYFVDEDNTSLNKEHIKLQVERKIIQEME